MNQTIKEVAENIAKYFKAKEKNNIGGVTISNDNTITVFYLDKIPKFNHSVYEYVMSYGYTLDYFRMSAV